MAPATVELIVTAGVRGTRCGELGLGELHHLVGTGGAEAVRPPPVTIHRSPEGSKTSWAPPLEEIVTVGAGFAVASSAFENSTTLLTVDTHRSPEASKASPKMGVLGKSEMVVSGVGPPELANWLFVYS